MHKTVKLWYYAADNTNPWELGTMIDLACPEVRFALDVVRRASALCQRVQTGMAMMGLTKSDFSPVTVADYAVQAMAGQMLAEQFPDALLVGEEKADALREASGAQMRGVVAQFVGRVVPGASEDQVCAWIDRGAAEPGGRYWTLDPVDGTKGYLRGGQYAVALALIDQGTVALGVLGCPNLGEQCQPDVCGLGSLLVARPGEGAWHTSLADDQADFHPLRVSACKDGAAARMLRSFESGHTNAGDIDAIGAKLGVQAEPVLMDSQAKFAVLASGGGELMFRFPPAGQARLSGKDLGQRRGRGHSRRSGRTHHGHVGQAARFHHRPQADKQQRHLRLQRMDARGRTQRHRRGLWAATGALKARRWAHIPPHGDPLGTR